MLRNLCNNRHAVVIDFQSIEKIGKLSVCKFYIKYRADDLCHGTNVLLVHAHNLLLVSVKQPDLNVPHRLQFR